LRHCQLQKYRIESKIINPEKQFATAPADGLTLDGRTTGKKFLGFAPNPAQTVAKIS
jgi:hypothetical protein